MISKKTIISNPTGLHARPASVFVKETQRYKSKISIVVNGKEYNAKSILGVLSAAAKHGTEIELICTGEDEAEACTGLIAAIESGLGES